MSKIIEKSVAEIIMIAIVIMLLLLNQRNMNNLKLKTEITILSGFIGFVLGITSMMFVNVENQGNCYKIIQDIEMEVCEECWHEVFEMGEKYEEVQYYVNGE